MASSVRRQSALCAGRMGRGSKVVGGSRGSNFFGSDAQIARHNLVPPKPLTKPTEWEDDLQFLVLDVNGSDTDFTHWISPDTTDRTILELYSFLYMLNRVFYHADQKCCVFVQQKERLVPGNLLVRKEIVAGHILYFGFDRQVLEEILPTFLVVALMINAGHFDARRLFVSPLYLDVIKCETWSFDPIKGVANTIPPAVGGKGGGTSSGTIGSYKTLGELGRRILNYHCVSHVIEDAGEPDDLPSAENSPSPDRGGITVDCRYRRLQRTMQQILSAEDTKEYAAGLTTLLSGPFLFKHSFRMVRAYREIRDLVQLNGKVLGFDDSQVQLVSTGNPEEFIHRTKEVAANPALPVQSQLLLDCLRKAVRRYHWESVFVPFTDATPRSWLDLTAGIAWKVLDGHLQHPFDTPLYTLVFPRDQIDRGMHLLREYVDRSSLEAMDELQRQLEAYGIVMGKERTRGIENVRQAAAFRQGTVDDDARKYPLFVDMRKVLEKLADALQPGSKVSELYRGPFAELAGKLVEDAVRNPNRPTSKTLESLLGSYPTLVDRRRHFFALHLNSLRNERTNNFVVSVHNPFDDTVEMSDGLLLNDFLSYSVACHSHLMVETVELRLAVTSGFAINTKNLWVGWQGPPGNGKTTCVKSVLHGISRTDGLCLQGMVREMDSTTTASMKSLNDDILLHCDGVGFVNELNDGGNDKSSTLNNDSSERSTLLKTFYDCGQMAVYRARVNENSNEVRQCVEYVIFHCVFIVLSNRFSICKSLGSRMILHSIDRAETTGDRMTLGEIFKRMDRFKIGHYEILKLFTISLLSIFEYVGCTLEDDDYLVDNERVVFHVIHEVLRAMRISSSFLDEGRRLDNIRVLTRMLAYHRATLTVLGCIDTFRIRWQEHDPTKETLDAYNQRTIEMVVKDLERTTLHDLVRRVQEEFVPSPADYITVVTMECLDQNAYFPIFRAFARALIEPTNFETTGDGRKMFVVADIAHARLCDVLNDERIPFEARELRDTLEDMTSSITRDGVSAFDVKNAQATSLLLTFDARMAAEIVIEADMMPMVDKLTSDIQNRIAQVVNELPPHATHDARFTGQTVTVDVRHYGDDAVRFFGFLQHLPPNHWTLGCGIVGVVTNFSPESRTVKVSCDFNHARLKLMRQWMLECAEDPRNVLAGRGYVRVNRMNQCSALVDSIFNFRVRDTFGTALSAEERATSNQGCLPFFRTGNTVYVHQALLVLRLGIGESTAAKLRRVCVPPDFPIEYWTFDTRDNADLLKGLELAKPPSVDAKYTTASDAFVCEQDLNEAEPGAWLHVSVLSRLESIICNTSAMSPSVPREFVTRCMRENLTDRKSVLFFNKRGMGPSFDVIKVNEVRSMHGGQLPRVQLPPETSRDFLTASLAMMQEGHATSLGVERERANTFLPRHEIRYKTQKYLAGEKLLSKIEERCATIHGNDFEARKRAIHLETEALTNEWMDRVESRYRPLRLGTPLSTVEDFMRQDGGQVIARCRGRKRKGADAGLPE